MKALKENQFSEGGGKSSARERLRCSLMGIRVVATRMSILRHVKASCEIISSRRCKVGIWLIMVLFVLEEWVRKCFPIVVHPL